MVGSVVSLVGGFAGAQSKAPDATLELSDGSVAAGIGFTWGKLAASGVRLTVAK